MHPKTRNTLIALAATLLSGGYLHAQTPGIAPADPRPQDAAKNLPSDTGSQTTQPSGAVTGAGQPQGTLPQRDEGAPGGMEDRARREAHSQPQEPEAGAARRHEPAPSTRSRETGRDDKAARSRTQDRSR